jgi:hypothetical protein
MTPEPVLIRCDVKTTLLYMPLVTYPLQRTGNFASYY